MPDLISFFIILSAGLFFSHLFNRLHLPWVVALLVAGVVIGPNGFDLYTPTETFEFLGEIGLLFLMFMAGLESRFQDFEHLKKSAFPLLLLNSLIPFGIGVSVGLLFQFDIAFALLLGIVFTSSSIAVIIPSLEQSGLLKTHLGKTVVVTTILMDALSIALLSILFQVTAPTTTIPLPLFYATLFSVLVSLTILIPKFRKRLSYAITNKKDIFEHELMLVFVILIGIVAFFQLFNLDPIIAGFFTGMVLSGSIKSEKLKDKLHTISYGIFIPVFFIIVGTKTDLSLLVQDPRALIFTFVIIVASVGAKFCSGWFGARISAFNQRESVLIGVASIPHLSTALAVTIAGTASGIINDVYATSIISLAIFTTLIGPILINTVSKKVRS